MTSPGVLLAASLVLIALLYAYARWKANYHASSKPTVPAPVQTVTSHSPASHGRDAPMREGGERMTADEHPDETKACPYCAERIKTNPRNQHHRTFHPGGLFFARAAPTVALLPLFAGAKTAADAKWI